MFSTYENFKLGLDIHGVIDCCPSLFSELSRRVLEKGGEVHIITGAHMTEVLKDKLKQQYRIEWTHLFSIADYHKEIGTKVWYDDKNTPWMETLTWDRTKGNYCLEHDIDLHIDDTERYRRYFLTPFLLYKS